MTFHQKVQHQVEDRFSPIEMTGTLTNKQIDAAIARGRRLRAEHAGMASVAVAKAVRAAVGRVFGGIRRYLSERRAIDQLRAMDDRQLADIGISRESIAYAVHAGRGKDSRYAAAETGTKPEAAAAGSDIDLKHAA